MNEHSKWTAPWQCQQDAAEDWPFNPYRIVHARTTCAADSSQTVTAHLLVGRWLADKVVHGASNMRSSAVLRSCAPPLLNLAAAAVQARDPRLASPEQSGACQNDSGDRGRDREHDDDQPDVQGKTRTPR